MGLRPQSHSPKWGANGLVIVEVSILDKDILVVNLDNLEVPNFGARKPSIFWGVSVILSHTRSIGVANHHGVATTLDGTLERTSGYPKNMRTKYGYGSIPINTIFRVMNIHLPAILRFTRGTRF